MLCVGVDKSCEICLVSLKSIQILKVVPKRGNQATPFYIIYYFIRECAEPFFVHANASHLLRLEHFYCLRCSDFVSDSRFALRFLLFDISIPKQAGGP